MKAGRFITIENGNSKFLQRVILAQLFSQQTTDREICGSDPSWILMTKTLPFCFDAQTDMDTLDLCWT